MRRNWLIIASLCLTLGAAHPFIAAAAAEDETASQASQPQLSADPANDRRSESRPPTEIDLGIPEPTAAACTASLDCQDGNVISCAGTSSCTVNHFNGTVNCDGNETQCPNFCKATLQHSCGSCGTYFCSCTSLSGNCSVGTESVTCDGFERPCYCPFGCCPNPPTSEC